MNNNHPLATGLLAGAAVGLGVGMLFAPQRGSETRTQLRGQVGRYAGGIKKGYRRASTSVGDWTHRGKGIYATTRDKVTHGAKQTGQYVREVADAVTRKARQSDAPVRRVPAGAALSTSSAQSHESKHKAF